MTAPDVKPRPLVAPNNQERDRGSRLYSKAGRYFAARGWAHLVLLAGVGIFLFPFLWMTGMSLKTDDEATSTDLFPAVPTFRAESPTVRPDTEFDPPPALTSGEWKALLPQLKQWTLEKLKPIPLPPGGQFVSADALQNSAAITLIAESVEKLKESAWTQPVDKLKSDFDALLTPDDLTAALDGQLGTLAFRGLQIRTLDAKIHKIFDGVDCVKRWHVDSGNAQLVPGADDAILKYHFDSPDDSPIVLSTTFVFPADVKQLHKVMVAMNTDDSWHRIDAVLAVNGQQWTSSLTTYIAQYRAGSMIFQPPTFDDTTYQPKVYVPLELTGVTPVGDAPNQAKLTLTIRPSGTLRAIYGKVQKNYQRAFRSVPFWVYIGNSTLLVALQMGGALFSSAFVAYAFARLNWPGKSLAFGLLLSTMMLPSQVTMIPSFVIWKSLGWYNTLNPLWVPAWFGSAFFIFLMTQHMKTIPRELEEAARIDGLNAIQTWWYIILPLVKPTLAAIAIMVFMGAWNDFMSPLIMLRDQALFPLSLGLFGMKVDSALDFTLIMAGNMLMTVPVIVIFFAFQRYFIEGVTVTGMKG